jgi:hypothetical protein
LAPLLQRIGDRNENRAHARKLDRAIQRFQLLLFLAPSGLLWSLFSPLPRPPSGNWHFEKTLPYNSIEEFEKACRARVVLFTGELKRLRKVCARAIKPGLGDHANYDELKHMAAYIARGLLTELSQHEVTGTKDAPFRAITSLFYEAASGQRNADLKRACDDVLRGQLGGTDPPI